MAQKAVPGRVDTGRGTTDENTGRSRLIRDVWSAMHLFVTFIPDVKMWTSFKQYLNVYSEHNEILIIQHVTLWNSIWTFTIWHVILMLFKNV